MKPANKKSKSLIDRKLSVEAQDMFFAAAEKMNLDEAAALLERQPMAPEFAVTASALLSVKVAENAICGICSETSSIPKLLRSASPTRRA
jgi:hypothetical protein